MNNSKRIEKKINLFSKRIPSFVKYLLLENIKEKSSIKSLPLKEKQEIYKRIITNIIEGERRKPIIFRSYHLIRNAYDSFGVEEKKEFLYLFEEPLWFKVLKLRASIETAKEITKEELYEKAGEIRKKLGELKKYIKISEAGFYISIVGLLAETFSPKTDIAGVILFLLTTSVSLISTEYLKEKHYWVKEDFEYVINALSRKI